MEASITLRRILIGSAALSSLLAAPSAHASACCFVGSMSQCEDYDEIGFDAVCDIDPFDRFTLDVPGSAFIALELASDPQTGNVDLELLDAGNVVVDDSTGGGRGLEVIHVRVAAFGSYEVRVSMTNGPAGAPYKLTYRVLPE